MMPKRSDATDRSAVLEPPDVEQKSFGLVNNELRGLVHVGMDTAVRKLRLLGLVYLRNDGGRYAERPKPHHQSLSLVHRPRLKRLRLRQTSGCQTTHRWRLTCRPRSACPRGKRARDLSGLRKGRTKT